MASLTSTRPDPGLTEKRPSASPRSTPQLIGLAGYARTGKDTVGAILAAGYGYERLAFADKLRELAWKIDPELGARVQRLGYEFVKDHYPEVRKYLVALGAGAREVLGQDVWLDATLPQRYGLKWAAMSPTVVTDVRYRNEAERIRNLGGEVWKVLRPGVGPANDEEARTLAECTVDRIVWNDGTLDDLCALVDRIMAGAE